MTMFAPTEALPLAPSPFQARVLKYRRKANIFNGGGRGSGKTVSLILDVIDHVNTLGPIASVLILRESWAGLSEISTKMHAMARIAFGPTVSLNKGSGVMSLPNGANVYFRNVLDDTSFASAQGRTYTMIGADEFGNFPAPAVAFTIKLFSNLRPPKGIRPHIHITANPFGRAHTYCLKNFVNKSEPWKPWQDEYGNWWVTAQSTYLDNPSIDHKNYHRMLLMSTAGSPALTAAWVEGNWSVRGAGLMFDMWDPQIHIKSPPPMHMLKCRVGVDWGTASVAAATLLGELKEHAGGHIPGDLFAIDVFDTCREEGNYSDGDGTSASVFAAGIKARLLDAYGLKHSTQVVVDNMRGLNAQETVVSIFQEQGLSGAEAVTGKNRVGGWARVRNLLDGAIHGDGHGLWVDQKCVGLIETLPYLMRDELRNDDVNRHEKSDHHSDSLNYAVYAAKNTGFTGMARVIGMY